MTRLVNTMFMLRKCVLHRVNSVAKRPLSRAISSYVAQNEPIYVYDSQSKERQELEEKLKLYDSKPFDHQKKLAKYSYANSDLIKKAIDVSQAAHRTWQRIPLEQRADIFLKAADLVSGKYRMDLMAATMLGQGKTIIQAEIDATCELADFYRFNVQFALNMVKWQPLSTDISKNMMVYRSLEGFVAAVAPFNFTAISGHLAGAPAFMGNVVLWKASDTAMLSSYVIYKLLREAGLPAGVINFVPADGPVFGDTVIKSPLLACINFTGSAKTFQHLWKQISDNLPKYRSFPRMIGECGGKNFHFVHSSANLESVVNGTIRSAFEYSGQKCSACSRMYVPESKWPQIRDRMLEEHKKIKLGSPMQADSFLSAVIDDKAFQRIKSYLDYAKSSSGISVLAGGKCDDSIGYYVEPTILQVSDPKDKIMQEEIFGPVLSVYVYKDAEYKDILKLIDTTSPYGLTGAIYADDSNVLAEASDALRFSAGNFYVNDKSTGSVVSQQPFGGARKSGTNDKAGAPHYLLRFCSPQSVKTTSVPATEWTYSYMK
ncbi:hypothetical protein LSH36_181g01002 [Paralvinella palmiformis]|uniref:Multifunctional fusion protein n=1 Tax=Paralvinella palmiformis TaxID=53620 RepID=A0AAD9N5K7_9ANNE|nr:hypothetical protein LSH36_181g01002 [Paralvinella palmiformis]